MNQIDLSTLVETVGNSEDSLDQGIENILNQIDSKSQEKNEDSIIYVDPRKLENSMNELNLEVPKKQQWSSYAQDPLLFDYLKNLGVDSNLEDSTKLRSL